MGVVPIVANWKRQSKRGQEVMRFLRTLVIVVFSVILAGCTRVEPDLKIQLSKQANPWTHLNVNNNPDNFQFAIVSDRTGGHRPGVFADAVGKLNLLNPEFVISIGDLIEGYNEDDAKLNQQWDEFDGLVNELRMPFFYVPGNHDISNRVMAEVWNKRLGPSYYHFTYRNVLFLCLNTEDTCADCISDEQIEYFRKVLEANGKVRWTLVFMHKPAWRGGASDPVWKSWRKIESLLADRPYTVFAGHTHRYDKATHEGRRYYVLAVTGGSFGGKEIKIPVNGLL